MAKARHEDVTVRIWRDTRHHEDDPAVAESDWRDPSVSVDIEGAVMVSDDPAWRGHEQGSGVEPNWDLGCHLEAPGVSQRHIMTFKGEPPEPFKSALLNGLVMRGVVVAEDRQRHN
jgi:hypothetical protein